MQVIKFEFVLGSLQPYKPPRLTYVMWGKTFISFICLVIKTEVGQYDFRMSILFFFFNNKIYKMLSNTTTKIDLAKEVTGEIANPTNFLRCLFSMSVIAGQLKSPLLIVVTGLRFMN